MKSGWVTTRQKPAAWREVYRGALASSGMPLPVQAYLVSLSTVVATSVQSAWLARAISSMTVSANALAFSMSASSINRALALWSKALVSE